MVGRRQLSIQTAVCQCVLVDTNSVLRGEQLDTLYTVSDDTEHLEYS